MVTLESLTSAGKKRKRIGRGGSRGGTSGRGHKGQKARSGPKIAIQFEGGQMPLTRRLPKRGFTNARFKIVFQIVNLKDLERIFDAGSTITPQLLFEKGLVRGGRRLIKVLGDGQLSKKFVIQADKFSKTAAENILQAGGEAQVIKASDVSSSKKSKEKKKSTAAVVSNVQASDESEEK